MDSEKTPGTDGLPAEFYKTFWDELASSLISALNYTYDQGTLSVSRDEASLNLYQKRTLIDTLSKTGVP